MALNLPNIPKLKATVNKSTGTGSSAAKAIGKIKAPPNLWGATAKPKVAAKPPVNPYDQFTLSDPYDPSKISGLAQSGYDADVANAQKLAAMGTTPNAQIASDYAGRGAAANQVQQALAARLANIQSADVAQGNAGSALLGQQNAAVQATAPHIDGAPAGQPLPTAAVQAVLGAGTAATGNYGGTLQAAALSSGAQANQKALDAGTVAQTDNTQNIQKVLGSLLAGVPLASARESSMTDANSKVDAANIQTKFSVYQNLVTQKQYAQASGDKKAIAAAENDLKKWTTQQTNSTKKALNIQDNAAKTTVAAGNNATSAANNRRTTSTSAANSKRAANAKLQTANAKTATSSPTTTVKGATNPTTGKPYRGYTVGVKIPKSKAGPKDLLGNATTTTTLSRTGKKFTANQWQAFLKSGPQGKRKLSILGLPEGSKVDAGSARGY